MTPEEEQAKKRKNNKTTGIIFIVLGIIGLTSRFVIGNNIDTWRTVDILKVTVSIFMLGYGVYILYKSRQQS